MTAKKAEPAQTENGRDEFRKAFEKSQDEWRASNGLPPIDRSKKAKETN